MRTYEDLQKAVNDGGVEGFIIDAINQWKASRLYTEASVAYEYYKRRNVTIMQYQKLLYTLSGEAVPDNYSANYKFRNGFFPIFVKQEASHLLGNGVNFNETGTKERLGDNEFDVTMRKLAKAALWGGVAFGFWNLDHLEMFKVTEFVPLIGEEDGGLHAGIRWWQIDANKPMRVTLYEEDGYTEYVSIEGDMETLQEKTPYKINYVKTPADGVQIIDGENYPGFPIVPLWGNQEHQTEFTGLREKVDGYDLIQSGFANDLDDASQIYWTIQNAGGMDDIDLAKFVERMKTVKAAVMDEEGAHAEAHTLEVPYAARAEMLQDLRDSLYRDAMALDTDKISAGNVTATAIEASYENLTLKCDDFETCVTEFINAILALAGIDDMPTYKRSKIINMPETTQMILSAAQYLDSETVLKHLPFLSPDEIDDVMKRTEEEEAERFEAMQEEDEGNEPKEGEREFNE
jgi:hypothetical protein